MASDTYTLPTGCTVFTATTDNNGFFCRVVKTFFLCDTHLRYVINGRHFELKLTNV